MGAQGHGGVGEDGQAVQDARGAAGRAALRCILHCLHQVVVAVLAGDGA